MKAFLSSVGLLPLILVVVGLMVWRRTHYATLPLVVGLVWGTWNVLFAKREISATVTAGEPTITYAVP